MHCHDRNHWVPEECVDSKKSFSLALRYQSPLLCIIYIVYAYMAFVYAQQWILPFLYSCWCAICGTACDWLCFTQHTFDLLNLYSVLNYNKPLYWTCRHAHAGNFPGDYIHVQATLWYDVMMHADVVCLLMHTIRIVIDYYALSIYILHKPI